MLYKLKEKQNIRAKKTDHHHAVRQAHAVLK
jgi:hypothetical protein